LQHLGRGVFRPRVKAIDLTVHYEKDQDAQGSVLSQQTTNISNMRSISMHNIYERGDGQYAID
jgi:hypothetical protein